MTEYIIMNLTEILGELEKIMKHLDGQISNLNNLEDEAKCLLGSDYCCISFYLERNRKRFCLYSRKIKEIMEGMSVKIEHQHIEVIDYLHKEARLDEKMAREFKNRFIERPEIKNAPRSLLDEIYINIYPLVEIAEGSFAGLIHRLKVLKADTFTGDVIMGDKFGDIIGSNFISKSSVNNSSLTIGKTYDPEVLKAVEELKKLIIESGNQDVIEIFKRFMDEMSQENPCKPVMKAFLESIHSLLPTVSHILPIISKIFGG